MKEHGIILKPFENQGIHSGTISMISRPVNERNSSCTSLLLELDFNDVVLDGVDTSEQYLKVYRPEDQTRHRVFSKIKAGDVLYGREALYCDSGGGARYSNDQKNYTYSVSGQIWKVFGIGAISQKRRAHLAVQQCREKPRAFTCL